jgi:hypothetical protein
MQLKYEGLIVAKITPDAMRKTLLALQMHDRTDRKRYERCLQKINEDLCAFGMRAEIEGYKCRMFYIGLDDIYAEVNIQYSPIYKLRWCAYWLARKVYKLHGIVGVDVGKLRALGSLPNPVKWAIADCIRWDAVEKICWAYGNN